MLTAAIQDLGRFKDISVVLGRHGFDQFAEYLRTGAGDGARLSEEQLLGLPRRFRLLLQDLGPTFIKLGQVLSTRPDILPSPYINELKTLQDKVAPVEFAVISKAIEEALKQPVDRLFARIDETPLASASIAQVHRATLHDGRQVVVKVQRPGIEKTIRSDLDLLYVLARLLDATVEESVLYRPVEIVKEFERAIFEELDFLHEARNMREFERNFAEHPGYKFPKVHDDLTARTVLCMEFVEGVKVSEVDRVRHDVDRVVHTLIDGLFQMIYVDGYFHGDPHPGNILVLPDSRVAMLDLGLAGRISKGMQDLLIQLSLAIAMKDAENTARLVYRLGSPVDRVDLIRFRTEIEDMMGRYMSGSLEDVHAGSLLTELMDLAMKHKIRVQPDFALLIKAAVTMEGVIRGLKPDLPIGTTIAPYTRKLLLSRYGLKSLGSAAAKGALGLVGTLQEFPLQLDQIMSDLESGRLTIRVTNPEVDKLSKSMNDLGSKVFLGLLACGLIIGACFLLSPYKTEVKGVPIWPIVALLGVVGIMTIVFWWHVLYGRFKKIRLSFWLGLFKKRPGEGSGTGQK